MPAFEVADPVQQAGPVSPSDPVSTPSLILVLLRQETRGEHEAVEQVLDLMAASLTREGYIWRLEQFYGFYAPLENALFAKSDPAAGEAALPMRIGDAMADRLRKTAHLQQDLRELGVIAEYLPLCHHLPPLRTTTEVLGCLYVLEGATLGGRMISQHVRATLGITPETGASFFEGYGAGTGKMWQSMRQLLVEGAPDTESENAIVANATATFAALLGWCQSAETTDSNRNESHG